MKKYIAILEDEHIVRIGDKPCLHCFNGLMNDYFIPVKERKAGEWVDTHHEEEYFSKEYKCSLCGEVTIDNGLYCPHCGAEMENGEKND